MDAAGDVADKRPQHLRGQVHPRLGDVGIDIATAQKYWCTRQRPLMVPRGAIWADQSPAAADDAPIAPRVASHVFQPETRPLGEAKQHGPFERDACRGDLGEYRVDQGKRGREVRLVAGERYLSS